MRPCLFPKSAGSFANIGLAPYAAFNVVLAKLDHDGRDAETSPWSSTWNQRA